MYTDYQLFNILDCKNINNWFILADGYSPYPC